MNETLVDVAYLYIYIYICAYIYIYTNYINKKSFFFPQVQGGYNGQHWGLDVKVLEWSARTIVEPWAFSNVATNKISMLLIPTIFHWFLRALVANGLLPESCSFTGFLLSHCCEQPPRRFQKSMLFLIFLKQSYKAFTYTKPIQNVRWRGTISEPYSEPARGSTMLKNQCAQTHGNLDETSFQKPHPGFYNPRKGFYTYYLYIHIYIFT